MDDNRYILSGKQTFRVRVKPLCVDLFLQRLEIFTERRQVPPWLKGLMAEVPVSFQLILYSFIAFISMCFNGTFDDAL